MEYHSMMIRVEVLPMLPENERSPPQKHLSHIEERMNESVRMSVDRFVVPHNRLSQLLLAVRFFLVIRKTRIRHDTRRHDEECQKMRDFFVQV